MLAEAVFLASKIIDPDPTLLLAENHAKVAVDRPIISNKIIAIVVKNNCDDDLNENFCILIDIIFFSPFSLPLDHNKV
jgi:hypothetical protein